MRVHQIAKQTGRSSKEVRIYLRETLGVNVKSASSVVGPPIFADLLVATLKNIHCPGPGPHYTCCPCD